MGRTEADQVSLEEGPEVVQGEVTFLIATSSVGEVEEARMTFLGVVEVQVE